MADKKDQVNQDKLNYKIERYRYVTNYTDENGKEVKSEYSVERILEEYGSERENKD